jgi:ribonucleotide reductase alpha subunit
MNLKCTEYHKFYIETSSRPGNKSVPIVVEAKNLEKNMRIIRYDFDQTTDNNNELKYSYTHGLFCADGTKSTNKSQHRCHYKRQEGKYFCGRHLSHIKDYDIEDGICCANSYSDKPMLPLYGEKIKLLDHIDKISHGEYIEKQNKINVSLPYDINEKYYVPINNSINSKIRWLEGYFDGDSCIIENDGLKNIQYCSINLKFMRDILLLLQTLGISSQIKVSKKEKKTLLPDGKGCNKYYDTKISYRSSIDSIGLNKLIDLGFSPKRLNIENTRLPHHVTNMFIKVENILDKNEYGDTYCFNEPLEHKGIFNGILTGQCAEIVEVSNKDETSVCNLASICLPSILEYPNKSYHDWYDLLAHKEKQLSEYYFKGQLKLLSEKDCVYCKLLKALLKENGLEYEEISNETAEELSQYCARPIPDKFTTIPQLFSIMEDGEIDEVKHLGGYTNTWNLLSPRVNHNKLYELSYDLTVNLNKIIDKNYYPTEKTKVSNLRHRPIGIGVQGLADLFLSLKIPFDSPEARKINKEIFETMYFAALYSSHDIALKEGSYSTFSGSPISEGIFQFNMWGLKFDDLSGRWDWDFLRKNIMTNGIRNSLLIALMPTASTSQIMGSYVECFEPLTSNLYTRRTLAGEFIIINPYLIKDLINLDMWNNDVKNRLQYDKGSVKNIKNFPFKDIYRTVWEIPQKSLLEMSADRGIFVCQSQSLNLFFEKPEYKKLSMAHLAGWKLGLKTGSYYIRSKPATSAQRFAMDPDVEKKLKDEDLQNKEETECLSCGA